MFDPFLTIILHHLMFEKNKHTESIAILPEYTRTNSIYLTFMHTLYWWYDTNANNYKWFFLCKGWSNVSNSFSTEKQNPIRNPAFLFSRYCIFSTMQDQWVTVGHTIQLPYLYNHPCLWASISGVSIVAAIIVARRNEAGWISLLCV